MTIYKADSSSPKEPTGHKDRTKRNQKSPETVKCPLIHLLHAVQQDVSLSGSSSIHYGRWNWVRVGTWAVSGTRNLVRGWNWELGQSKGEPSISLLLFQLAGPSWCWLCSSELFLRCGRKEADVLGTETSSSHLQNLFWNTLRLRNTFSWRPEASKELREKQKKASALVQWSNSFSNLARMKRERGSVWVSCNSQSDPGTPLSPEPGARQLSSAFGPWVLEAQWQSWA